ncbi:isoprenylcysteine carboxylmethyltransferase family protein [Mycobacterium sp.]|uniref:isoprenylcysteine carboxylmethyltransferase family protein n=1 Tax=Mycobacterium sp. TaxID=1785 RepID=UPI003D0FBCF2
MALLAVFAVLGFGWRTWLQRRCTGSYGFHGVSGRVGSVEWIAGVGFVVAMAVAGLGPLLQFVNVTAPLHVWASAWLHVAGAAVAVVGIALTIWAQLEMGDSWRIGVDSEETTQLVHSGVFGLRNPIYSAMLVFEFGIALLATNPVTITGFVLALGSLELQVRGVEEPSIGTTPPGSAGSFRASG